MPLTNTDKDWLAIQTKLLLTRRHQYHRGTADFILQHMEISIMSTHATSNPSVRLVLLSKYTDLQIRWYPLYMKIGVARNRDTQRRDYFELSRGFRCTLWRPLQLHYCGQQFKRVFVVNMNMHGRHDICLVCRSCGVYEQCWVCMACWSVRCM